MDTLDRTEHKEAKEREDLQDHGDLRDPRVVVEFKVHPVVEEVRDHSIVAKSH